MGFFTKKVVINNCFGGFGLSWIGEKKYKEISGKEYPGDDEVKRDDKYLVQVVEELGQLANGNCAELKIIKICKFLPYTITEYDGAEGIE